MFRLLPSPEAVMRVFPYAYTYMLEKPRSGVTFGTSASVFEPLRPTGSLPGEGGVKFHDYFALFRPLYT